VSALSFSAFAAVGAGAAIGAWLRWLLGLWLNAVQPNLPFGTLAANLIGGYLVGVAVAFFATNTALAPEWRLAMITGFLGGLTTFSTFSAEAVSLLGSGRYGWAIGHSLAHLAGSLLLTVAGIATYQMLKK
jgi:fluoride exporter